LKRLAAVGTGRRGDAVQREHHPEHDDGGGTGDREQPEGGDDPSSFDDPAAVDKGQTDAGERGGQTDREGADERQAQSDPVQLEGGEQHDQRRR
jgi:hypothetical protein